MAVFKTGISLPLPFRRWELSVMVLAQGSCEKAARRKGCKGKLESHQTRVSMPLSRTWCLRSQYKFAY